MQMAWALAGITNLSYDPLAPLPGSAHAPSECPDQALALIVQYQACLLGSCGRCCFLASLSTPAVRKLAISIHSRG